MGQRVPFGRMDMLSAPYEKNAFSLEVLLLLIAIAICFLVGYYKNPQMREAMKGKVWGWGYFLFVAGSAATVFIFKYSVGFILLWGALCGNGTLLLKYRTAKKQDDKMQ